MTRYTVTPWRTQADLIKVREQLYTSGPESKEVRRYAVNRIMAWKLRGNLPHAVESTALLVDAILHHDPEVNSSFSIRAVYSAAFCRFVTGFCDIGRHRERALEPSSMLEIARQIDMPAEFVALRHEATHEELPGLQRLMEVTQKALDWIWRVYWSRLDSLENERDTNTPGGALKKQMADILRDYRRHARDALLSTSKKKGEEQRKSAQQARDSLNALDCSSEELTSALIEVLLGGAFLTPTNTSIAPSTAGSHLLWGDLIEEMQIEGDLGVAMLERLTSITSTRKPQGDAEQGTLVDSLMYLLGSGEDLGDWRSVLAADTMKSCCLYPSYWTTKLAEGLRGIWEGVFVEWVDLYNASRGIKVPTEEELEAKDKPADEYDYRAGFIPAGDEVDKSGELEGIDDMQMSEGVIETWQRMTLPPSLPMGVAG